ncbi:SGNH hydrolase-type esterase domain-containing protein [Copromyces sp. CBS 386.78]|nr:SGNH hydrolase-type esterase domain-containing protein [Copromyces sp. CBS 386.78]
MIIPALKALLMALSTPLANQGVTTDNFGNGGKAVAALSNGVALRIMPLGASITYGQASTDGNGYRSSLRDAIVKLGNPVNMVGSRQHGSMKDNEVEGWPGYKIHQVHAKARTAVPAYKPNVVLINAGTNDATGNVNLSTVGDRMGAMIDEVFAASPRAVVILSTLIINTVPTNEERVVIINDQFRGLAQRMRDAGKRVILVDMHDASKGPIPSDMFDTTHPTDVGYRKMANIWYQGIVEASSRKWLQAPEPVGGMPDSGVTLSTEVKKKVGKRVEVFEV